MITQTHRHAVRQVADLFVLTEAQEVMIWRQKLENNRCVCAVVCVTKLELVSNEAFQFRDIKVNTNAAVFSFFLILGWSVCMVCMCCPVLTDVATLWDGLSLSVLAATDTLIM